MTIRICKCGHTDTEHDLNRAQARTKCWHLLGPHGIRCMCGTYREAAP